MPRSGGPTQEKKGFGGMLTTCCLLTLKSVGPRSWVVCRLLSTTEAPTGHSSLRRPKVWGLEVRHQVSFRTLRLVSAPLPFCRPCPSLSHYLLSLGGLLPAPSLYPFFLLTPLSPLAPSQLQPLLSGPILPVFWLPLIWSSTLSLLWPYLPPPPTYSLASFLAVLLLLPTSAVSLVQQLSGPTLCAPGTWHEGVAVGVLLF